MNSGNEMRLVHPGEILRAELDEIGLSANALGVPVNRVTTILNGQRGVAPTRHCGRHGSSGRHRNSG